MDVAAKEEKTREGEAEAADKPTTRTAIARQRFAYNYNLLFEMRVECLPHLIYREHFLLSECAALHSVYGQDSHFCVPLNPRQTRWTTRVAPREAAESSS